MTICIKFNQISIINHHSVIGVENDRGAGVSQAQRRGLGGRGVVGDGGEELEEPPLSEAGEDGAAQPAVQPPERDPRQAGHHRRAQQGPLGAGVLKDVSEASYLPGLQRFDGLGVKIMTQNLN